MGGLFIILMPWVMGGMKEIPQNEIRAVVEHHVRASVGGAEEVLLDFRAMEPVTVSGKSYTLRVVQDAGALPKGNIRVPVEISSQGVVVRRVFVPVSVRTFDRVGVAAHRLGYHEELSENNVLFEKRETTFLQGAVSRTDELKRKWTRRMIAEGTVISPGAIEEIPAVRANDPVTLIVRSHGVTLSTRALAREGGRKGSTIQVRKADSREVVRAKVVGDGMVELSAD